MDKEREFQAEDDIETFDAEIVSNDIEPAKAGKICNHPGCTNERDVPELLFCASCRERAQREVEAVDKYLGMVIAGITVGVQAGGLVTLKAARSATNKGIPNLPQLLLALTFLKSQTGHFKAEMESWSGSDQRDLRLSMLHSIRSTSLLAANGLRNAAPTLGAVAKTTTGAVGRTAKNARDTFAEAASNTGSFVVDATRATSDAVGNAVGNVVSSASTAISGAASTTVDKTSSAAKNIGSKLNFKKNKEEQEPESPAELEQ